MSRKVVITGINGFIGGALAAHFRERGWEVVGFSRNPDRPAPADRLDRFDLAEFPDRSTEAIVALQGAEVLVHCAYVAKTPECPDAARINIKGTSALLEAARAAGVKRFVFLSTLSAHEGALSDYGLHKAELESIFDPHRDLVLKLGLVIGPGGLFGKMSETLKKVRFVPLIDNGRQPIQTLDLRDLVRAVDGLIERGVVGRLALATPIPISMKDLHLQLIRHLRTRNVLIPVPFRLLYPVAWVAARLRLSLPITPENLLGLRQLREFDTTGEVSRLGFMPRPLSESLSENRS